MAATETLTMEAVADWEATTEHVPLIQDSAESLAIPISVMVAIASAQGQPSAPAAVIPMEEISVLIIITAVPEVATPV